ncbi:retrovirus-related pol polyprotein from transposon TNT 1-94 [Tanacetum coccineum]
MQGRKEAKNSELHICEIERVTKWKVNYNYPNEWSYVRRNDPEPGDADREVPVPATFHEQTDDELTAAEIKQMEADDQAIQTILLGLPEDIYAAVDSCETAQEIWLRGATTDERFELDSRKEGSDVYWNGKGCHDAVQNQKGQIVFRNLGYGGLGLLLRTARSDQGGRDAAYLQTVIDCSKGKKAGIQLQAEEFVLTGSLAEDLDELRKSMQHCILRIICSSIDDIGQNRRDLPRNFPLDRVEVLGSVFSKQYWTEAVATACYTQNRSTIMKRHLKTPYEIFRKRILNINFIHVFGCPVYIHNDKDHLGKFDEKADDVDNINIAKTGGYPSDEYLHHYEPSQRYQTNNNDVSFIEAQKHPGWVDVMQEELNQFARNKVCTLVPAPHGIDYDETFAPIARLEKIRIFLAFATYMNFIVYQMDVKSAFLNGKLKEVYVKQPPGFESNEFPNHVCKLDKALYGLKQAPSAWSTSTKLCKQFAKLMTQRYEISFDLKGYSDSDYAGCNMDRKSTSGACQLLGGKLVCWSATKQQSVAMSSVKAEYVAAARWDIELHFIPTQYQLADIFTKPLDEPTFKRLIVELGGIRGDIGYNGEIGAKGTLKKSFLLPSFFHFHFESTSGCDASVDSTAEADPGTSAPNDYIPSQQGMHEGTKNFSLDHIFSGTNPSVLIDQTKSARDGSKTAHTDSGINKVSNADEVSKKIKLEDLSDLMKDTRSAFLTPDSPQHKPIIVSDKSEEDEPKKYKDTHTTSHDVHLLQTQKNELEQQKATTEAEPELSKLLASYNFASCLPTKLKELPSKFTELSREIKELKQLVKDMEIKLPGDLKEIPTKLVTFTSTISSLTSQVAELKNIKWELPAEFQALPVLVSSVKKKFKTLDSLPSLLNKVTETLNRFATVMENASGATTKDVPSAGQATTSPAEGEKNTTKDAETNLQNELVDLLGINTVEQYHNKKLLFDKYYDKVLKRRKSSKIINCDVDNA